MFTTYGIMFFLKNKYKKQNMNNIKIVYLQIKPEMDSLKAENKIFRWLVFNPSMIFGIDRSQSYFEKWIISSLMKAEKGIVAKVVSSTLSLL